MIKFNFNISVKIMVVVLAVPLLLASCKKNDDEVITYGNAKFRLVNAVQGSAAQDFYQSDTKISTTAVAYGQASDYLTVKAGISDVSFKPTGSQDVSGTDIIAVNEDVKYTVFYAKNTSGSGRVIGFAEINSQPPSGKIGIRFINLGSIFTNALIVGFNTGESLTTDLAFGNMTAYAVIDPNVDLKVSLIGSSNSTVIPGSSFQANKIYTVWFDAANTTTVQYHVVAQE